MEHETHENLAHLEQQLDELDPSPGEMLVLFNHMVGWLASTVDEFTWHAAVARAVEGVHKDRVFRP